MLESLRNFYLSEKKKGRKHKDIIKNMSSNVFDAGCYNTHFSQQVIIASWGIPVHCLDGFELSKAQTRSNDEGLVCASEEIRCCRTFD